MNEDHEEGCARVDMLICIFTYSFILTGSQCLGTIDRASDTLCLSFIVHLCEVKSLSNGGKGIDSKYVYKLV